METELGKIKHLFKLKEIDRAGKVKTRAESTAEHTWSSIILAEYFLKKLKPKRGENELDELKVLKLLMYHDLVEIESGDINITDIEKRKSKKAIEEKAFRLLKTKMPVELVMDYDEAFNEYENLTTREAKFAKAIDALEPMIHWLDHKPAWRETGFTEKFLREKKEADLHDFPELLEFFNKLIDHIKKNDYID